MITVQQDERAQERAAKLLALVEGLPGREERAFLYHLALLCVEKLHDSGGAIPPDRVVAQDGWPAGWVYLDWLATRLRKLRKIHIASLPGSKEFPRYKLVL